MNRWGRRIALTVVFGALIASPIVGTSSALADDCDDTADESTSGKNYKTIIDENGRKVFVIEKAVVVCGKVPKPNVIYVLQASSINYEWESLKKEFLPKVMSSVTEAPF